MIDTKTRAKLKAKLHPAADQYVWSFIRGAPDQNLHLGVKVLDAGCGEGTPLILRYYRSRIGRLVGVDIQAPKEKKMDEFVLCDLGNISFKDATFDVIICNCVIEHLRQPQKVFAEFWRLLSDGGILIFRAPCINAPMFLLSRVIPVHWHETIKRTLLGDQEVDVFHAYYRCNTSKKLEQTLKTIGFRREKLESIEQIYSYFKFNWILYAAGLLFSRLMQSLPFTEPFRSQLIGVYHKP